METDRRSRTRAPARESRAEAALLPCGGGRVAVLAWTPGTKGAAGALRIAAALAAAGLPVAGAAAARGPLRDLPAGAVRLDRVAGAPPSRAAVA
jgi:hypothetical protein